MERPVRSSKAEFWRQLLDEHRQSNLTVAAFCSQNAVSVQSFYQCRRKLRSTVRQSDSQTLVPVRLDSATPQRPVHKVCSEVFGLPKDSFDGRGG